MEDSLAQAKATLEATIHVVETNAPINEAEGNLAQALLERQTAEQCRLVLEVLDDELTTLEIEMRDRNSDYWKGPLSDIKQKRYRSLLEDKQRVLKNSSQKT
jgi:hypothetical protein